MGVTTRRVTAAWCARRLMTSSWIPFLKRRLEVMPPQDSRVSPPPEGKAWGLYLLYALLLAGIIVVVRRALVPWSGGAQKGESKRSSSPAASDSRRGLVLRKKLDPNPDPRR